MGFGKVAPAPFRLREVESAVVVESEGLLLQPAKQSARTNEAASLNFTKTSQLRTISRCFQFEPAMLRGGYILVKTEINPFHCNEFATRGNVKINVLPEFSSLSAWMVPPCDWMTWWAMARPRPVPPDSRDRALST